MTGRMTARRKDAALPGGGVGGRDRAPQTGAELQAGAAVHAATFDTPDGPFTLVVDEGGAVRAAGWSADVGSVLARAGIDTGLVVGKGLGSPDPRAMRAVAAVRSFYEGDPAPLLDVPVHQDGTEFQQAVWEGLRRIPVGSTLTYGQLADSVGKPRAARAVGAACGRNAVALFVPCHRVVGVAGTLTGFAWGVETKRSLLRREKAAGGAGARCAGVSCARARLRPRRCR